MSAPEACRRCDHPIADSGSELCAGCENERQGRCRWCAIRPPVADGELCAECDSNDQPNGNLFCTNCGASYEPNGTSGYVATVSIAGMHCCCRIPVPPE